MKKSEIYYLIAVVSWFAIVIMFITNEVPRTPFLNLFCGIMGGLLPAGIFFVLGMNAKYDEIERNRIKNINTQGEDTTIITLDAKTMEEKLSERLSGKITVVDRSDVFGFSDWSFTNKMCWIFHGWRPKNACMDIQWEFDGHREVFSFSNRWDGNIRDKYADDKAECIINRYADFMKGRMKNIMLEAEIKNMKAKFKIILEQIKNSLENKIMKSLDKNIQR